MKHFPLLTGLLLVTAVQGQVRSSADYEITTDTLDFGGQLVTSADYSIASSVGPVTGVSENGEPVPTVARHGYIGQLYELLGYGLLASDYYPPEEGSSQLIPVRTADDGTNLAIPATGFTFVPLEGPIPGISPTGLVETTSVHEDTLAIVGATSPEFEGQLQLGLYVLDTLPDNYSTYAADGLPDAWQRQFFGLENPLAAPRLDPDGDGQDNLFEYIAGIIPTDPHSRFLLRIDSVPDESEHKKLTFSPRFEDRRYRVTATPGLDGPWLPLGVSFTEDDGEERTVTDLEATGPRKFYHIEITKP